VLAGFAKQWEQFTDRLDALGKSLQAVDNAYEQVNGPRRRQLERQLDKVDAIRQRRGDDGPVLREVSTW
jgi:DNA anti-recombination protein RmuC